MTGWYDAKLISENRAAQSVVEGTRTIDNVVDAVALIVMQHRFCSGTDCTKCPMYMYGESCDVGNALDFFSCKLTHPYDDPEKWNEWYEKLTETVTGAAVSKAKPKCSGRCNTCTHCEEDFGGSGIAFCIAWHNFTADDGYCYLYQMDEKFAEEAVDN